MKFKTGGRSELRMMFWDSGLKPHLISLTDKSRATSHHEKTVQHANFHILVGLLPENEGIDLIFLNTKLAVYTERYLKSQKKWNGTKNRVDYKEREKSNNNCSTSARLQWKKRLSIILHFTYKFLMKRLSGFIPMIWLKQAYFLNAISLMGPLHLFDTMSWLMISLTHFNLQCKRSTIPHKIYHGHSNDTVNIQNQVGFLKSSHRMRNMCC